MQVRDMMAEGGRVWLKSEFEPISDRWPCVSYSKRTVGKKFRAEFEAGRDMLIYVGTTSSDTTKDPDHQSRLLSAVVVHPGPDMATAALIPPEVWASTSALFRNRWQYALSVVRAADMIGPPFPDAYKVVPTAYSLLGNPANFGTTVEVTGDERAAVMALDVSEIKFNLPKRVLDYLAMMTAISSTTDVSLNQHLTRLAKLIIGRVERGEEKINGVYPIRHAPNYSELVPILKTIWDRQKGECPICEGQVKLTSEHSMLQPSADRIDSANPSYDALNVQITHLGCNYAKNKFGMTDVQDWLDVVRHEDNGAQAE